MSPGARTRQVTGSSSPSMASTSPTRAKTRLLTAAPGTAGPIPREAPSPGAHPARAHEFVEVADRPHQRVRHLVNSHPADDSGDFRRVRVERRGCEKVFEGGSCGKVFGDVRVAQTCEPGDHRIEFRFCATFAFEFLQVQRIHLAHAHREDLAHCSPSVALPLRQSPFPAQDTRSPPTHACYPGAAHARKGATADLGRPIIARPPRISTGR